MSDINKSKTESSKKDEAFIYNQTNPSFHGNSEDAKNYRSLQNKSQTTTKSQMFVLKPSILTDKAEKLRTDKEAVKSISSNNLGLNKFLVFGNNKKDELNEQSVVAIDKSQIENDNGLPENDNNSSESVKDTEKCPPTFVFGQNIFERVVTKDKNEENDKNQQEFKDLTGENVEKHENGDVGNVDCEKLRKNAEEVTHKTTAQHLDEVEMITGEEDEKSILKLSCKIFLYSNDQKEWVEKGFSFVHVNDRMDKVKVNKSRLVARSKGGLKVIINTFIWADMVLERASDKSLRITAQGEDGVRSYLLRMLNNNDADILYHQLYIRKSALSSQAPGKGNRKREVTSSSDECCESKRRVFSDDDE